MKDFLSKAVAFVQRNPARVAGIVSAVVVLAARFGFEIPGDVLALVAAVLFGSAAEFVRPQVIPREEFRTAGSRRGNAK